MSTRRLLLGLALFLGGPILAVLSEPESAAHIFAVALVFVSLPVLMPADH